MRVKQASYLIVRVADRLCALPAAQVIEVLRVPSAVLAGAHLEPQRGAEPGPLLGFLTLRGEQVAALELGLLLGFQGDFVHESGCILGRVSGHASGRRLVAARVAGQTVALAVDEVIGVELLASESLTAIALPGGAEQTRGRFDAGFAQLIDASGLVASGLASGELISLAPNVAPLAHGGEAT